MDGRVQKKLHRIIMTLQEYFAIKEFPVDMVTLVPYRADDNYKLKRGDSFVGIEKKTFGSDDYSIIDEHGHPHHFTGCDLLYKD